MVRVSQTSQNKKASRQRVLADLQDPETSFESDSMIQVRPMRTIKLVEVKQTNLCSVD